MDIGAEHGPIQGPCFYWVGVAFPAFSAGLVGVSAGWGKIVKVACPKLLQLAGGLDGTFGPLGGLGTAPGLAAAPWVVVPGLVLLLPWWTVDRGFLGQSL